MQIEEAKEILKECSGITKFVLAGGIDKVHGSQAHAMNRLVELKNELPQALVQRALEKENDVDHIKVGIAECEEILADAPLTLQELTRMQAANDKSIREAQDVIEKHEHRVQYNALKAEILSNTYTEGQIEAKLLALKAIAHSVSHYGAIQVDYERFLEEMQGKYKGYRISR